MARLRDPLRANQPDGFADIPYPAIARWFVRSEDQRLVPFLGAGASRSGVSPRKSTSEPIDATRIQSLARQLSIDAGDKEAFLFVELAVAIIDRLKADPKGSAAGRIYETVKTNRAAPSATELALALSEQSAYDFFAHAKQRVHELSGRTDWDNSTLTRLLMRLAGLTGIGSEAPPLLDASSYRSYGVSRETFWRELYDLFENKDEPTATHQLVGRCASRYLEANRRDVTAPDYLIVTTNYDSLIEEALDRAQIAYYVLTVPNGPPARVDLRFSDTAQEYLGLNDAQFKRVAESAFVDGGSKLPKTADQFAGLTVRPRPLAVIYKIHGSLHRGATPDKDAVVITNEDYVNFLSLRDAVPSYIRTRLRGVGLLLLGYSFNDWNVRSLYRSIVEYRGGRGTGATDYAVLYDPSPYETGFFDWNGIDIFDTTLELFCERLSGH